MLKGIVLDNPTGRPLARAQVTVLQLSTAGGERRNYSVLSDSYGRFEFQVPEGVYLLNSSKRNYAPTRYGQQTWRLAGAPISVAADAMFFAELRMKRFGVITGEVWDENHLGIPNVRVVAYRSGKVLREAARGESDERGAYRIYGLTPGKYYVRTAPKQLEAEHSILPTFYGQTPRREGALLVSVRLEQDSSGVNIEPAPGRLSTVTITTQPIPFAQVTISLQTDFGIKSARVAAGEPAVFDEISAGQYEATAEAMLRDGPASGATKFAVDKPIQPVSIKMDPWSFIHILCTSDRGDLDPTSISLTAVRILPDDGSKTALSCSQTNRLPRGIFDLKATVPSGIYFDSIAAPAIRKEQPYTLDFMHGQAFIRAFFATRPGTIRGVVKAGGTPVAGVPVILNALAPDVQAKLRSAPYVLTGLDGRFEFRLLPPGQYEVVSSLQIAEPEEGDWEYPSGKSVLVEPGKTNDVEIGLTVIPGVE